MVELRQERLKAVMRPDPLEKKDSGYRVTSVYFDDYWDTSYHDAVKGNSFRRKYRIRIYNDCLDVINAEIKSKRFNTSHKLQRRILEEDMVKLLNGESISDCYDDPSDPVWHFNRAIDSRILRPKVVAAYERKASISSCGKVRITFDRDICSSTDIDGFGRRKRVKEVQ